VADLSRFYEAERQLAGTHLALRWNGRVRYTVPRKLAGQKACWRVFQPGRLGIPLRAMALLPWLPGSTGCVESENLALIRESIGKEAGLSSCRGGHPGPWYKETILFLDERDEPLYVVKAGAGEEVDGLFQNEVNWLRALRDQPSLAGHIPELVAHRSGSDLCFVAQRVVAGQFEFQLGDPHFDFLRKLQESSLQIMRYEDSKVYRTLSLRINGLKELLTNAWASRLEEGMRRIKCSLSDSPITFVTSHNDFTPWNVRLERGVARVFDWEYADTEQLPLFDPIHFTLAPMALRSEPPGKLRHKMRETVKLCQQSLGEGMCSDPETQALAYLINLCTLYIWADRGKHNSHPTLVRYAQIIDDMSQDPWKS
jgi:hypothetical protein